MNILAVGDVFGKGGCEILKSHLKSVKKLYNIDLCIVNGENSAPGNGITPESADSIFESGADIITTGNHVFHHSSIYDYLDKNPYIIRPANYPETAPGKGYGVYIVDGKRVLVINLLGTVYMDSMENPFLCAEKIMREVGDAITIVDFHAEATSEKRAMGFFLDGIAAAVFGTHTHVQTNDAQTLPKGTAYLTDLGMTGPYTSVLGADPELAISRFLTKMPTKFKQADGKSFMSAAILCINDKNRFPISMNTIQIE